MQHQMSNKKCQGICQKITVNGPKHHLDDRICTDLGWFAGFVWMWQRQKWEWHQMAGRLLRAKNIHVEPENAAQSGQIPEG